MKVFKYLVLLLLPSCMSIYKAPIQVTPAMKEKGDLAIAGAATFYWASSGTFGQPKPGISGYVVYSPLNQFYVGASANKVGSESGGNMSSNHSSYQFLTGYYKRLDADNKAFFDLQAGGGMGKGHDNYFYNGLTSEAENGKILYGNFSNVYLQPGVHLGRKFFKSDFALKCNLVHVYAQHQISINWNTEVQNYDHVIAKKNTLFLEPSGTVRFKTGPFNYFIQGALSIPMDNSFSVANNSSDRFIVPQIMNLYAGMSIALTEDFNLLKLLKKNPWVLVNTSAVWTICFGTPMAQSSAKR